MENSNNICIRTLGRPKKYFSHEERLIAGRIYCKKYNSNNQFYCVSCDKVIHPSSKSEHLKSIKHSLHKFTKINI